MSTSFMCPRHLFLIKVGDKIWVDSDRPFATGKGYSIVKEIIDNKIIDTDGDEYDKAFGYNLKYPGLLIQWFERL